MKSGREKKEIGKRIVLQAAGITVLVVFLATGSVLADEGIVERKDACRKGTLIIKTTDDTYVAAIQAGLDDVVNQTPWSDDDVPSCSFLPGEKINGDLSGAGTVTLTNSSGRACDYVIEGSAFSMQEAVQILGCE